MKQNSIMSSIISTWYTTRHSPVQYSRTLQGRKPPALRRLHGSMHSWNRKEFPAATEATPKDQALNYTGIFSDTWTRLHPQLTGNVSSVLKGIYQRGLQDIRRKFSVFGTPLILPAYNARKNVGYETQRNYHSDRLSEGMEDAAKSITSLDLLRHYRDTGVRIPGPMEMRVAWFYNDLKPRVYYANGGDSYFAGLYIQPIANLICKILPSTHPFTRFQVNRVGPVRDDSVLITYDYTSFTSSLSELKFFLHWLALTLVGVPVDLYDPHVGAITVDLGHLLQDYNAFANQFCAFSVERIDKHLSDRVFHMGQGGCLGIKGNIVLSTSLHGLALADLTNTVHNDCVIGDDALTQVLLQLIAVFIACVNNLGDINSTKFSMIKPRSVDPLGETNFKFTKRPLSLDPIYSVPVLGGLDFFPDFASVLYPEGDGVHTTASYAHDPHQAAVTFIMQVCKFTLQHTRRAYMTDLDDVFTSDEQAVIHLIQRCYQRLGLPIAGSPPGYKLFNPELKLYQRIDLFIPPVDSPVLITDGWIALCYSKWQGCSFTLPVTSSSIPPPEDHFIGQEFYSTTNFQELRLLVALEYMESEMLLQTVEFDEALYHKLQYITNVPLEDRDPMISLFRVIELCPHYHDLMSPYFEDTTINQDVLENMTLVPP
ncbi:hypothetical protein [Tulasnella ambivirus 5]|uniref:Uncharacterized protein n=1 Tax=Tulasnella ambivirus 5 TaxID=2772293 RepID=A0A7S7YFL2_9VIRU|nr:hypothetical protein [Tulasnella ambivirus 5]